jgi:hypothetical protein
VRASIASQVSSSQHGDEFARRQRQCQLESRVAGAQLVGQPLLAVRFSILQSRLGQPRVTVPQSNRPIERNDIHSKN